MKMPEPLRAAIERAPHRTALIDADRSLCAAELGDRMLRVAAALIAATPPIRALALCADNGLDWVVVDLAAQSVGVPLIPLPAFFTRAQCEHAIATSGVDALIAPAGAQANALGFSGALALDGIDIPLARRRADDAVSLPPGTAKVTFTSGTTGTPKGVPLSAHRQWQVAQALHVALAEVAIDRHLCLLPLPVLLENVAGIYAPLLRGAACCVPPLRDTGLRGASAFDAFACLTAIERYDARSVILLPQMLLAIVAALSAGARLPASLRFCAVGGARVSPSLVERARALGLPVYEGYGLSECASVVSLNTPATDRPGSAGMPLSHARVHIAPDGEILVEDRESLGANCDAEADAPSRVATGDLGRIDADGYLYVEGRRKQRSSRRSAATFRLNGPKPSFARDARSRRPPCSERRDRRCAPWWCRVRPMRPTRRSMRTSGRQTPDCRTTRVCSLGSAPTPRSMPRTALRRRTAVCGATPSSSATARACERSTATEWKPRSMLFFDTLQLATAQARAELFSVPVIGACLAGRVTRAQYLAFLGEAYHHVRHTVPLMMACGSRLSEGDAWLRDAIADYIDEERGHEQWILDDIAAAGGDADAIRDGLPGPATELMVAYVYDYVNRRNPVGFFGMVHVLEGTSVALATQAARSLERTLALPSTAFRYLRSHGAVDEGHVRFFMDLMNRLQTQDDRAAVVHVATMVYRLYAEIFRTLPFTHRIRPRRPQHE